MKAAILKTTGLPLQITNVPLPEPGHGQILVKIIASGVCHSDLTIAGLPKGVLKPDHILGHEGAGVIAKVGPGVTHLKVGDRVGCPFNGLSCGHCENCHKGEEQYCPARMSFGYNLPGCYAEYTLAHANYVARIPDKLSFEQAAPILCAGLTAYKGIKETDVKPGQWIAIVGASGGLGHLAVQYARHMGLKVLALDLGKDKIDYCLKLGAHAGVDLSQPNSEKTVYEITDGGAQGVIVFAPVTEVFQNSLKYLRNRGVIVGVAIATGAVKIDIMDFIQKGKTYKGTLVGSRKDLQEALDIAAFGGVKCDVAIKTLDDINQIFDDMHKGIIKGRVVMKFESKL